MTNAWDQMTGQLGLKVKNSWKSKGLDQLGETQGAAKHKMIRNLPANLRTVEDCIKAGMSEAQIIDIYNQTFYSSREKVRR